MVGNKEEASLKVVVSMLSDNVEKLNEKVDCVVTAQEKVDSSLQEFAMARRTGVPVQVMKAEIVEKTIKDNLNTGLVNSTVKVSVNDPVASIDNESKNRITKLISASEDLVKTIKPRRPLMNFKIYDGKKFLWFGLAIAGVCLIATIWAICWAYKKVNSIQEQAFYWGDRAYQAALLNDDEKPGDAYHEAVSHFSETPNKVKEYVDILEKESSRYQEIKTYLLSLLREKDTRDIRIIAWELDHGEYWILYRFFDEETERSIHKWPDGKVEETADRIVKDLVTAQKYAKRKIWTLIREPSATGTGE